MKFSCQDKILPGETYTKKYLYAVEAGFDGIEINASPQLPLNQRVEEIKKASKESGIIPSTVCGGYRGWLGHFEKKARGIALKDMKDILIVMPEIGAKGLVIPAAYGMFSKKLPPFTPPRSEIEDKKVLIEGLMELGEYARNLEIMIILEPLNRYEDHMINSVEQCVDILKEVNNPYVSGMMDLFHANIEEIDMSKTILEYKDYIKHIHLADSNRLQPGKGHTDFKSVLKTLRKIEYNGFCALECGILGDGLLPLQKTLSFLKESLQ